MSEKSRTWFDRLFGRNKSGDVDRAQADRTVEEAQKVEETGQAVKPDARPETAEAEPHHEPEPGPPESQPEWAEAESHPKGETSAAEPTPDAPDHEAHPHASPAPPEATLAPGDAEDEARADAGVASEPEPEPTAITPAPEATAPEPPVEPEQSRGSWFQRLRTGLRRTSDNLTGNISAVFTKKKLDDATLEELEDILIQADLGVETAMSITEELARDRYDKQVSPEEVRAVLAAQVEHALEPVARPLDISTGAKPFVILMVGVNGSGKTTTIGKLAQKYGAEGKKVMLAAGDTFRAAAIEQLQVWGERTGAPVVARPTGADASGLAYDAVTEARDAGSDVLIIDTAGRLQNRDELMAELEKVIRVIRKVDETAPHAVLLTLDATTGQNAMNQVEIFGRRAGVTGLVMTKLDGTARGGILVAIANKHGLPVHFIGVGESAADLEPFAADEFAAAIAGGADA